MPLDFSNAKILTYSQRNEFWGEAFRYASKKELSIQGCIYALSNSEGVAPVWSGVEGWIQNANDYDMIILNGVNFGSGRLNSINFKEGNDVRLKEYDANLTVYNTGNLFNLTGEFYSGLNFNDPNNPIWLTDNFSENFEYNIKEDGSFAAKQTVNVKFISGKMVNLNVRSAIEMAQGLSSGLFQHPFFNLSGRKTYTENYNLLTNECSFTKNIELDYPSGNYSVRFSHECNTDQNGITTVTENGRIKGLVPDYFAHAELGYDAQSALAYGRCQEVNHHYVSGTHPLTTGHVTSSKKINTIIGEIEYSLLFTNDPKFNVNYTWDYTAQLDREPNSCFYKVSEQGHIQGRDNSCSNTEKDQNALDAYDTISVGIFDRLTDYYESGTDLHNPLKFIASTKRHNPYQGTVDYTSTYSDNLYYGVSPGIKKVDYECEDTQPIRKYNKFGVINAKELVQDTNIYSPGNYNCTIRIFGERGTSLGTLLNAVGTYITGNRPTGIYYLDKSSINYNPNESVVNFNATWQYFLRN